MTGRTLSLLVQRHFRASSWCHLRADVLKFTAMPGLDQVLRDASHASGHAVVRHACHRPSRFLRKRSREATQRGRANEMAVCRALGRLASEGQTALRVGHVAEFGRPARWPLASQRATRWSKGRGPPHPRNLAKVGGPRPCFETTICGERAEDPTHTE